MYFLHVMITYTNNKIEMTEIREKKRKEKWEYSKVE
jgi:hypothetical protein